METTTKRNLTPRKDRVGRVMRRLDIAIIALIVLVGLVQMASASEREMLEAARIIREAPGKVFAYSAAMHLEGDHAYIGGKQDDGSEAVQVMRLDGADWVEEQLLRAPDPSVLFGKTVHADGDVMVVTAPQSDAIGAVYVFRRSGSTWLEEQKLLPTFSDFGDKFAGKAQVDGNTIMVNAERDYHAFVIVFEHDGSQWVETQTLLLPEDAGLGNSTILMANGNALISGSNAVYHFTRGASGWIERQQIVVDNPDADYTISHAVAIADDGRTAIIGAHSYGPDDLGVAYVYRLIDDTWVEEQTLEPTDRSNSLAFGTSGALDGDTILIGDPSESTRRSIDGAVYVFRFDGSSWNEEQKLKTTLPVRYQAFGNGVAMHAGRAFLTSSDGVEQAGSLYDFRDLHGCLVGGVNAGTGSTADVLFLNGESGGVGREMILEDGEGIELAMQRPPSSAGKFVLHANWGKQSDFTPTPLPAQIGTTCFPFLISSGATPAAIWNGIGKTNVLGTSRYFDGSSQANPDRAPTTFLSLPNGDAQNLPIGTEITFQGVILDRNAISPKLASVTNGIVLAIH